ncbi:MAG: Ig-like domain-containing protein, partial [Muribaculaceae bacterium]|nr:Ig-like domain-containing protein [Muribaculaceae bacterium]
FSWGMVGDGVSLTTTSYSFKLTEADATLMKEVGFAMLGDNITVSKIEYVEGIDPYLLWEGDEKIDYTEKIVIPANKCEKMQANQQIILYFTTVPGATYTQLGLIRPSWQAWAGGNWQQYPSLGSTSCVFDILEDNLAQLKQGGFRVIGNGIQLTKVMWKDQVRDKTVLLEEPLTVNVPSQEIAITYDQLVAAQAVVGSGLQIEYEALEGEPESGQHFKFFHQGNADNEYEWIEFTDLQTVNSEGKSILILNRTTMDEINSYHKTLILQAGYAKINKIKTITALDIPGTAIMLDKTEGEIRMDQTLQLTATVRPADLFVSWTSSDESIATVDANGLVTPVAPGKAIITAAAGTAKATCEVTVNPLLGINVVWGKLSWQKPIWGESADIRVPINPAYSPRLYIYTTGNEPVTVTYTMDPEKALTVYNYLNREDGKAVGAMEVSSSSKAGKVTFEIALKNYPDIKLTASCEIYVPEKPSLRFKYYSSSDVLDPSTPLMIGQMTQISVEVEGDPNDSYTWRATETWSSSDPSVLFVSEDGELLPLKRGKATITCVLSQANLDDVTDSIEFTVQEGGELAEYYQLTESSRGTQAWSSIYNFPSDGDPADLSTFVFKKNTYTYTVEDNQIIANEVPLIEFTTSAGSALAANGNPDRNRFPVFPEGAVLTFKSMQPGFYIKSVYRSTQYNNPKNSLKELPVSGAVDNVWTAPGIGVEEAKLTLTKEVKCSDGPYWFVELVKYGTLSGIEISKTEIEGIIDGSEQLSATITPSDAAPAEIAWTSSDEKIATVDAEGLVKFIAEGTATITASVGEFKAECKVTVKRPAPEAIALDKTEYEGFEDTTVQLTATVTPEKANPVTITWTSSNAEIATVDATGL